MEQAPDQNMDPVAPMTPNEEPAKGTAYGSVLGIVLIVAILVAGAFYVWNERLEQTEEPAEQTGVRGEMLPDGSMPSVEGDASVDAGAEGPQPQ